jgi:DNA-binding GntR family transcriptional regulator
MLEFIGGAILGGMMSGGSGSKTSPTYSRTEVHEHRAPTDASVKLLMEMEDAAKKKFLGAFVTRNNDFHATLVQSYINPLIQTFETHVVFKLNGRDYVTQVDMDSLISNISKVEAEVIMFEKVSQVIALQLMRQIKS